MNVLIAFQKLERTISQTCGPGAELVVVHELVVILHLPVGQPDRPSRRKDYGFIERVQSGQLEPFNLKRLGQ